MSFPNSSFGPALSNQAQAEVSILIYLTHLRLTNCRNLKVLLSIGGGTASGEGHFNFVGDAPQLSCLYQTFFQVTDVGLRANFVTSAVQSV